jgi:hypothetical protein
LSFILFSVFMYFSLPFFVILRWSLFQEVTWTWSYCLLLSVQLRIQLTFCLWGFTFKSLLISLK